MRAIVPNRFLFDFEFPLRYRRKPPRVTVDLADFGDADLLPPLGELDDQAPFARVWACWSDDGIYVAWAVDGKRQRPQCDVKDFWKHDNVRLCLDMRDTRTIRRASRHCQQFVCLPTGWGKRKAEPVAWSNPIHRAREQAPPVAPGRIAVAAECSTSGYRLVAHFSTGVLAGFEPGEHPRLGFYYMIEDTELGQQYLTVGDDLSWHIDPSTWPTAVLAGP